MFKIFKKNKSRNDDGKTPKNKEKKLGAAIEKSKSPYSKEEEEVLKKRLRDLGYID